MAFFCNKKIFMKYVKNVHRMCKSEKHFARCDRSFADCIGHTKAVKQGECIHVL